MKTLEKLFMKKFFKKLRINLSGRTKFEDFGCLNFNLPKINKFKKLLKWTQ